MKYIRGLLLFISLLINYGCSFSYHDEDAYIKGLKSCNIVIQFNNSKAHSIDITGYNPLTKEPATYNESGAFYIYIYEKATTGDTLTKKEGGNFLLKKRKFNIAFSAKCEGHDELAGINQDTIPK